MNKRLIRLIVAISMLGAATVAEPADSQSAESSPVMPVPKNISAQARAYYENLQPRPSGGVDVENPKALAFMRKFLGKIFLANAQELGIEYTLEPAQIENLQAYWIRNSGQTSSKALIYLHGGGYILGSATTNVALPVRINQSSGIPVLSVEYRLAPEHPFPAGLMDALGAYRWLLAHGHDASSIGVFGDSAGGGLALALALIARDEGLPQPGALAVLSPSTDQTRSGDTQTTLGAFDPILGEGIGSPGHVYAGDTPLMNPLISPVYADLTGIGPLLIQVGTRERLLSGSVRLARRAREAGVDVTLDVWEGMWHVWQDNPTVPEAAQASQEISEFFTRHLR
jgi:monoterpene epsilon-lactone hydrolase